MSPPPASAPTLEPRPSLWRRLTRGVRRLRQQGDWASFAGEDWPERILGEVVTDRLHRKQGRSIARWTLQGDGRRLVVYLKRHYRLPWWRGLLATLFPRRAWSPGLQEWEHLIWAAGQGLPVPRAVAAGEWVGPWGRLRSFLAVEELAGMLPLHEAVPRAHASLAPSEFARWKQGLVAEMARITRELHGRRVFHKDLYLCHFYVPESVISNVPDDWRGGVCLIDLHRLARHRWTFPWWQVKDLAQLLYSSEVPGVTARDRLRFWRLYRGGAGTGGAWARFLRWCVRLKWRRYRGHNRKRKPTW
ncbi:MAG TPA: lipopolysaccharide kinase InaA family protein [Gemmataceae bacterium]